MLPSVLQVLLAAVVIASPPRPASQVHLALTNAVQNCENGVAVSFASETPHQYQINYKPIESAQTLNVTTRPSESYGLSRGRYSYKSPYLHSGFMCNLLPNTAYQYEIVGGGKSFQFLTPPATGSDAITVLSVVGDPGDTTDSSATLEMLATPYKGMHPHALIVAGDYSYANGEHEVWDRWFNLQEVVFGHVPTLGINGNHETVVANGHAAPRPKAWDMVGENYLGYLQRILTPISNENKAKRRTYYSFDIGLVHLVFLDDYVGSSGSTWNSVGSKPWLNERTKQLTWLVQDLEHVNRTATPWVVVIKHNPFYNTWRDHQCQCSKTRFHIDDSDRERCWEGRYVSGSSMYEPHCGLQAKLEPIYAEYGVDVVMTGHVHGYERTAPIYQNKINEERGTVYITTGAGGNYEGHAGPRIPGPIPEWSRAVNNKVYGASKVIATKDYLEILWFTNTNSKTPFDSIILPVRIPTSPFEQSSKKVKRVFVQR
ncbi:hypothetical protein THRCLA_07140 [Thraustotheca clavata]|uniref:Purple acid phosphatase n=1 Tax=Thraustotheca clavata TaxID=74557 RepID=A0A1V9ZFW7_9STRA|nr:hypothetical protein THRCLA_07140 [Thraustotheca clavata]